jgi:predicted GIY-YIG superfamily endonuclease
MRDHNYYVYIVTNKHRSTLYIGVTNDLDRRMAEHKNGEPKDLLNATSSIAWSGSSTSAT